MTIPTLTLDINELKAMIHAKQHELRLLMQAEFHRGTAELFETYPALESILWHQYIPYFNDGDACTFRANIDETDIHINDLGKYDTFDYPKVDSSRTSGGYGYDWDNPIIKDPVLYPLFEIVSGFLGAFGESYLQETFGDCAEVTIDRTGVKVEFYDHD